MLIFDINIKNRIKYVLVDERGGVRRGRLLSPAACAAAARRRRGRGSDAARRRALLHRANLNASCSSSQTPTYYKSLVLKLRAAIALGRIEHAK